MEHSVTFTDPAQNTTEDVARRVPDDYRTRAAAAVSEHRRWFIDNHEAASMEVCLCVCSGLARARQALKEQYMSLHHAAALLFWAHEAIEKREELRGFCKLKLDMYASEGTPVSDRTSSVLWRGEAHPSQWTGARRHTSTSSPGARIATAGHCYEPSGST